MQGCKNSKSVEKKKDETGLIGKSNSWAWGIKAVFCPELLISFLIPSL